MVVCSVALYINVLLLCLGVCAGNCSYECYVNWPWLSVNGSCIDPLLFLFHLGLRNSIWVWSSDFVTSWHYVLIFDLWSWIHLGPCFTGISIINFGLLGPLSGGGNGLVLSLCLIIQQNMLCMVQFVNILPPDRHSYLKQTSHCLVLWSKLCSILQADYNSCEQVICSMYTTTG